MANGRLLWVVGIVLWAATTYGVLTILSVKATKPPLSEGMNGGWLVAVVAAQSVAVLGVQLADGFATYAPHVLLFCLAMWLGGGMLYIWIIALIFYRYTFFTLDPRQLAPPYWINMGAMAISTLAGAVLATKAEYSPLIAGLLPFVKGLSLWFWATATWWIPLLLLLGLWRHVLQRVPILYDVQYWSMVFPLGMYAAATIRLIEATSWQFLRSLATGAGLVAVLAWTIAFAGLLRSVVGARRERIVGTDPPAKGNR